MEYSERVLCGTGEVELDPNIVSEEAGKLYSELQVRPFHSSFCNLPQDENIIYLLTLTWFYTATDRYWDPWWKCGGVTGTHICVGPGGAGQLQSSAEKQGGGCGEGESWTRAAAGEIPSRESTKERKPGGEKWYLGVPWFMLHALKKIAKVGVWVCLAAWIILFSSEVSGVGWPNWTGEESHEGEGQGARTTRERAGEESERTSWPALVSQNECCHDLFPSLPFSHLNHRLCFVFFQWWPWRSRKQIWAENWAHWDILTTRSDTSV